jgi:2-dehydropantoate 2-reductase
MRFIIYGAGGIGGAIGGRLHLSGHDVVLIARGRHMEVLRERGLKLRTPDGDYQLPIPAVAGPAEIEFRAGDVVMLTTKTQDTESALHALELAAPPDVAVICAQNGVENERLAARRFANVYAMLVALPATHLEPGEVIASAAPLTGALHAGRYPSGLDSTIEGVCAALRASNFIADADSEPMKLKYRKLQLNLGNGLEVAVGQTAWGAGGAMAEVAGKLREEAAACYAAAGIEWTQPDEYQRRVSDHYRSQPIDGKARGASSTWQSVLRGHSTIEVDYLNGEICLLGRLHGVATPYNDLVRRQAVAMAAGLAQPGSMTVEELVRSAKEAT